jgi:predicted ester cyclase
LRALYARYNDCNRHDFGSLGLFVADDVRVDDKPTGVAAHVAGLEEVVRVFPDYRWEVRHLLVEPPLLAAHLVDSGTHRGTFLGVGRITDVWVTADNLGTLEQLRA